MRISQDKACDKKNYYMYNPAFDKAGLDCCKKDKYDDCNKVNQAYNKDDNKPYGCGCNNR